MARKHLWATLLVGSASAFGACTFGADDYRMFDDRLSSGGGNVGGDAGAGADSGGSSSGGAGGETGGTGGDAPATGGTSGTIEDGEPCDTDGQCESSICRCPVLNPGCSQTICIPPTCQDQKRNGTESDEDCGGTCKGCDVGGFCHSTGDCAEGACENNECQPPSCEDLRINGDESDRDCGGSCPNACSNALRCFSDGDCKSGLCREHQCVLASCTNGQQDGNETAVDCGGQSCACCATTTIEYTAGSATAMFGGAVGPGGAPRAVGQGTAFKLSNNLYAKSFALNFDGPFLDGDDQPKIATLVLQVRDPAGKILHVYETTVDASFVGGWVTWDMTLEMFAGTTYYFTTYVKDSLTNLIRSSVRADSQAGSAITSRYVLVIEQDQDDEDFESFFRWAPDDNWDLQFRLNGCPP